jgi:hypothetical protein
MKSLRSLLALPDEAICRRFLILAVATFVAWLALLNAPDEPDIFMQLATGRWVLEHHGVPATDPFSSFGEGKPWVAYSWLLQVACYAIYATTGWLGLFLAKMAFCALIAVELHALVDRHEPRPARSLGIMLLAVGALSGNLSPRPWLASILLFTVELSILLSVRADPRRVRWLAVLPPLFALWANVHIQFVYGLAVLGAAAAEPLLERFLPWVRRDPAEPRVPERVLWLTLLGALLGTCVGPYHVRVWGTVLEYATAKSAYAVIAELTPPSFQVTRDWFVLAASLLAVFALGWRRTRGAFFHVILAGAIYGAFHSRRDSGFLAVVAAAVMAFPSGVVDPAPKRAAIGPGTRCLLVVLACVLAGGWMSPRLSERRLEGSVHVDYPDAAAAFVAERGYKGPVYCPFHWGNFLYWRLPALRVVIDGRTNVHGDERIVRIARTWGGLAGWAEDPDLATAGVVIGPGSSALSALLEKDARFRLVYRDSMATAFVPASVR